MRDESSASNADVTAIPSQSKVTKQILLHWQPFRDLKLMFAGSRRAEQLSLRSQQRVVVTVEESVFCVHVYGCSDPGDCGEAARDLRLKEISVRPLRGSP